MKSSFRNILILFLLSFVVTAVFSFSLKTFFVDESWTQTLSKGLLIPCFTWTVLLVASAIYLTGERRLEYWAQLGVVCLIGSIALLPAAFYNFFAAAPSPAVSVVNVLASVAIMFLTLYARLKARRFDSRWAFGWMAAIVVNMLLYIYSIS
jgi:hypothetical protein